MAGSQVVLVLLLSTCVACVAASDCTSSIDAGTTCGAVKFFYDKNSRSCYNAYMFENGGNDNQFDTKELCEEACKGDNPDDACELPYERGTPCNSVRWFYFSQANACRRFGYNGVGGNGNNYETQEECEAACKTSGGGSTGVGSSTGGGTNTVPDEPTTGIDCTSRMDSGRACGALKYYYNARSQACVSAYIYDNGGNDNQFDSREDCNKACTGKKAAKICELPYSSGSPCNTARWFYQKESKTCRRFGYNGVGGNGNNYETQEDCEAACVN